MYIIYFVGVEKVNKFGWPTQLPLPHSLPFIFPHSHTLQPN
jgi:hypothetical protein